MVDPLRVLIVDDVTLARQRLRRLLCAQPGITVLGEADDATEALLAIRALTPDLVFLDIEMPERDGFSVLAGLTPDECPLVVFVTAYDQYAVRAFEANAVDYLLKPVEPERLAATLQRVRERRGNGSDRHARLGALSEALSARSRYTERISVRGSDATEVLRVVDVDWIEAAGNYLCLRAAGRTHVVRETLTEMQGRLDPSRFVRIHRSRIVNIERIARLTPLFNGDHTVILHDGTELALSRTYRAALFAALGTGD
jgi:two-component system LytT family response regulator